ncbi:MAG: OB-fold domain-containing protein [Thermomicrobia bacterium]|nr:OB-fold domain-containing protein [Thermomicrobia bacterium]
MADYKKPLPQADPVTAPYWESLKAHAMKIQRCNDTGKFFFYPRGMSPYTLSHAFTIVYANRAPGFAEELPYVVALIELDEGVRMTSNLIDVQPDPEHVTIGMPVELVYDDVTDEITLPKFRPAQA